MPLWSSPKPSVGVGRHSPSLMAAGFGVLVLIALLPVWIVEYFPSQDGPNHLLVADVWAHYDEPETDLSRTYFELNQHFEPNFAVYPLLAALGSLTASATAEKLLVTIFVILSAAAGVYVITSVNHQAWPLFLFLLPLVFGYDLHMGFYNFVLSLIGFSFVFGYWLRHRHRLTGLRLLSFAAACLGLVMVHLVGFIVLAYAIGAVTLVLWIHARRAAERSRPSWRDLGWQSLRLGLAFLPPLLLAASFVLRHQVGTEAPASEGSLFIELIGARPLFSFSRLEPILAIPLLLAGATLAIWHVQASVRNGLALALLTAIGGLVLIYFFVPLTTRGVPITERLVPFMATLGVLWLATSYTAATAARHRVAVLAAALSTLLLTVHRAAAYRQIEEYTREYMSAASDIEPRSTLLTLNFWGRRHALGSERITWLTDPFLHLGARIAAQTHGVYLRASVLSPVIYGYFPIVYRSQVDPFRVFGLRALEPGDEPPEFVDIASYNGRTSGRLDYILLWPMTRDIAAQAAVELIVARLSEHYDLVYVSSGRGLVHLYRRRAAAYSDNVKDAAPRRAS